MENNSIKKEGGATFNISKIKISVQDNHVNDTIVDQLLAKMDGIKQLNNILVIG